MSNKRRAREHCVGTHRIDSREPDLLALRLDCEWFRAHPRRSHRVRRAIPGELRGMPEGWYVAVCQVHPGFRLRTGFRPTSAFPEEEAPEHIAHAIFDSLADTPGGLVRFNEFLRRVDAYTAGAGADGTVH